MQPAFLKPDNNTMPDTLRITSQSIHAELAKKRARRNAVQALNARDTEDNQSRNFVTRSPATPNVTTQVPSPLFQ